MEIRKKEVVVFLFLSLFVISLFSMISQVSAVGEIFWCAERTTTGQWCQNVPANQIDNAFRKVQTSCEATSFCKVGTCVDANDGLCRPNVAQRVCQESRGQWYDAKQETLPQCQLGCCLIGDQASFVTQTACRSLATTYGVSTNFRSDIRDSDACIALSNPQAKGACVIDDGGQRDCQIKTKAECNTLQATSNNRTVQFNEGLLCTADILSTRCAPTEKTTCVEGKFGVYFVDSCGNTANIYDASKVNDEEYWTNMKEDSASCGADSATGNAGSLSCGNCDYLAGSTCKPFVRGSSQTPNRPQFGDFLCADLSCEYKGQTYKHGEEWCAADFPGIAKNLPGSESFILKCYGGEVTSESCDPKRGKMCYQSASNAEFKTAACLTNQWQDCVDIKDKESCEDIEERDCKWVVGTTRASLVNTQNGTTLIVNNEGERVEQGGSSSEKGAWCVPKYAPGQSTWEDDGGGSEEMCFAASENCVVKFGRGNKFEDFKCKENCHCLDANWAKEKMNQCMALGDCGTKTNYRGVQGDNGDSIEIFGNSPKGWDLVGEWNDKLDDGVSKASP